MFQPGLRETDHGKFRRQRSYKDMKMVAWSRRNKSSWGALHKNLDPGDFVQREGRNASTEARRCGFRRIFVRLFPVGLLDTNLRQKKNSLNTAAIMYFVPQRRPESVDSEPSGDLSNSCYMLPSLQSTVGSGVTWKEVASLPVEADVS